MINFEVGKNTNTMHKKLSIILTFIALTVTADLSAKKAKEQIETPASDSRIEYTG